MSAMFCVVMCVILLCMVIESREREDEEPCKNCCGVSGESAPDLWGEK